MGYSASFRAKDRELHRQGLHESVPSMAKDRELSTAKGYAIRVSSVGKDHGLHCQGLHGASAYNPRITEGYSTRHLVSYHVPMLRIVRSARHGGLMAGHVLAVHVTERSIK